MKLRLGGYPWEDEMRPYYKEKKKADLETHAKFAEIKKRSPEINFKDMPPPFVKYMRKVQAMEFKEEPDYEGLQKIFIDYLREQGHDIEFVEMDWTSKSKEASLDLSI